MKTRKISTNPYSISNYLKNTIANMGIAWSLARNIIQERAAQTFMGYFISLLLILITTGLYWLIFGVVLKENTDPIPYPLFLLTGVISWHYFSNLVQQGTASLIQSKHLISKIYFPRVLLPISKIFPGLVDFGIAMLLCIILIIIWQIPISMTIILLPLFLLILVFSGLAISLFTSSISIRYRDLTSVVPIIVNFGFFITPVFYPSTIIPDNLEHIMYINPAAFAIEGMRWAIFGSAVPSAWYFISLLPMTAMFLWGWNNIRRKEKCYADII